MAQPRPFDIRGIIFDLDGVITDTADIHFVAWQRLAEEVGIPFTVEHEDIRGLSRRASLDRILDGQTIDEDTARAWMNRKNNYFLDSLKQLTPDHCAPGIREIIESAKARDWQVAVGSASKNVRGVLSQLDLSDAFHAIGDGNMVVNYKPAPDVFMWVAGRLNLLPWQIMVFEDSEVGVSAALRGGFYVVGLGPATKVAHAHLWLSDLDGIDLDGVLTRLKETVSPD